MGNEEVGISLSTFEADAEKTLEAVTKLGGFVSQYGSLIPGLGQYVGVVTEIDKIINGAPHAVQGVRLRAPRGLGSAPPRPPAQSPWGLQRENRECPSTG